MARNAVQQVAINQQTAIITRSGQFPSGCRPQVQLSFAQVSTRNSLQCLRMAELHVLSDVSDTY